MSTPERRTTPRYRVGPKSFAYYALGCGAIRDIGLEGVFIEDRLSSVSAGTQIEIELRLGEESVSLRGVVRRSYPKMGFAVQFLDVPADTKQRLQKYFRTHFGPPAPADSKP